ncbi:YihY/virulence factor BrkB family protein [uncultured Halopseudomonas sp.]|uniref:YihY/virulence factor BrkB family protein n=1 Tax=uncultured Halopseudomonas sp. TaxID=2901193 RepID=UPI0030EE110C|tara:strand:+ start:50487 stop:51362 length:876 start_codon:yes stop_codon:yes gene_type:complete
MAFLDSHGASIFSVLKKTFKNFIDDDMPTYAAALSYRALFSLFPFLLFLIAMLSFLNLGNFFTWLREQAALVLPSVAVEMIDPVISNLQEGKNSIFSVAIVVAIWVASNGIRSLMNAMNRAYNVRESRPAWKLYLLSLLYTVGIAVVLLVVAALMVVGPQWLEWLASWVNMGELAVTLWALLRWPAAILLLMLVVAVLYYLMPDVEQKFRFITPGSVIAVIIWIAASLGFGFYVSNFGNYDAMYGGIGAMIVLLLFFYISSAVLLLGAELNATIEHASTEGKDRGEKQIES